MEFWGSIQFPDLAEEIAKNFERNEHLKWKMIGLLFVRSGDPLVDKEITPHYAYFNKRSGKNTDFYWAGWGTLLDDTPPSPSLESSQEERYRITFDENRFNSIRSDVQDHTNWEYSGGADLILFGAHKLPTGIDLDFGAAMCLDLREMKGRGVDPDKLFESIFRFSETYVGPEPIINLFIDGAARTAKKSFWSFLSGFLPKEFSKDIDHLKSISIKNIGKNESTTTRILGPKRRQENYPNR